MRSSRCRKRSVLRKMSSILDTSRERDLCKVESWALELGDVLRLEVYIESRLYKYCHETASRDQICKEWPYRERGRISEARMSFK